MDILPPEANNVQIKEMKKEQTNTLEKNIQSSKKESLKPSDIKGETIRKNIVLEHNSSLHYKNFSINIDTNSSKVRVKEKGKKEVLSENRKGKIELKVDRLSKKSFVVEEQVEGFSVLKKKHKDIEVGKDVNWSMNLNLTSENKIVEVTYQTPPPEKEEERIPNGKKVKVYSNSSNHYYNVSASTDISESKIKPRIYHLIDGKRVDITNKEKYNVRFIDENNNSKYDRIEWNVPKLSEQEFEIIEISDALHLDENRNFIRDVYDKVKEKDDNWATINNSQYLRATFEENLTEDNDITIYARPLESSGSIDIYKKGENNIIASFDNIDNEKEYKTYLEGMTGSSKTFDLKMSGDIELDYITDPTEDPMGNKGAISTTPGDTPFYTIDSNPQSCNLDRGESCTLTWRVNATGSEDTPWNFYGIIDSIHDSVNNMYSEIVNVTITSLSISESFNPNQNIETNEVVTVYGNIETSGGERIGNNPVSIYANGNSLGTTSTDSTGFYEFDFSLPTSGTYDINVTASRNNLYTDNSKQIKIWPSINVTESINPDTTQVKENVSIFGHVELYNGTILENHDISIYMGEDELKYNSSSGMLEKDATGDLTTDSSGNYNYTYQIPSEAGGAYIVKTNTSYHHERTGESTKTLYVQSGDEKLGAIPETEGAKPFYTIDSNPQSCNLDRGESCTLTWRVNATGHQHVGFSFYGIIESIHDSVSDVESSKNDITIAGMNLSEDFNKVSVDENESTVEVYGYLNTTDGEPVKDHNISIYIDGNRYYYNSGTDKIEQGASGQTKTDSNGFYNYTFTVPTAKHTVFINSTLNNIYAEENKTLLMRPEWNLTLNGVSDNITISSGEEVDAEISVTDPSVANMSIYREGVLRAEVYGGGNLTYIDSDYIEDKYYNITAFFPEQEGYLSDSITYFVIVGPDATNPDVTLLSPENNSELYGTTEFRFHVSDNFLRPLDCSLYLNGTKQENKSVSPNSNHSFNISSVPTGFPGEWYVNCTDEAGNSDKSEVRNYNFDSTKPFINITSPSNGTLFYTPTPELTVFVNDSYSSNFNYSIFIEGEVNKEGGGLTTGSNNITTNQLENGTYEVIVQAIDEYGNKANSTPKYIEVDNAYVSLISPEDNFVTTSPTINFDYKYIDDDYSTADCSLYVNGALEDSESDVLEGTESTLTYDHGQQGRDINWLIECETPNYDRSSERAISIDYKNPWYSDISENPESVANYTEENNTFSITAKDNIEIGSVVIEHNFSGTPENKTLDCSGSDTERDCSFSKQLSPGNYYYKYYINDSFGLKNSTEEISYIVQRETPSLTLNSDPSWNEELGTETNITCSVEENVNISLYRDGVLMGSSVGGSISDIQSLDIGTYNYVCNSSETSQYRPNSISNTLNITKKEDNIGLFLNGNQNNLTIAYGEESNATAISDSGTEQLFRDGIEISNPDINNLGVGYYEYLANSTGNSNYSSGGPVGYYLNVTRAQTNINLSIEPDHIYTGQQANFTCNVNHNQSQITLYEDGAELISGFGNISYSKTYSSEDNYTITCNTSESQNYTSYSESQLLGVGPKSNTTLDLTANPSWNEVYGTETTVDCSANHNEAEPNLFVGGESVSIPHTTKHPAGEYNYTCNISETANYQPEEASNIMNITKTEDNIGLFLNGNQNNLTIAYGEESNATAISDSGTEQLFRDGIEISNPDINNLGVGYYEYLANSTGNSNYSSGGPVGYYLNVTRATPNITLNSDPSWNEELDTETNITCSVEENVNISLYRDGVLMGSSVGGSISDIQSLDIGTYNYVCNSSETSQYRPNSISNTLNITKKEDNIGLFLNGNQNNLTIAYGEESNATAISDSGTEQLFRDGIEISNPDINNLGVGYYEYLANSTGNSNYSSGGPVGYYLNVTRASPGLEFSSENGFKIYKGQNTTIVCNSSDENLLVNLYRDGSLVNTSNGSVSEFVDFSSGSYDYKCNTTGNNNYSKEEISQNLNVSNKTETKLVLDSSEGWTISEKEETTLSCEIENHDETNASLFIDDTLVSSPYNFNDSLGDYSIKCNSSETENYSSETKTKELNVREEGSCNLSFSKDSAYRKENFTVYCNCLGNSQEQLFREGNNVTEEIGKNVSLDSAGTYGYLCYANQSSQYLYAENTSSFTITKTPSDINLTLNGAENNITVSQEENVDIVSSMVNPSEGSITVFEDGSIIREGENRVSFLKEFNNPGKYKITSKFSGNSDYSSTNESYYVNVLNTEAPEINLISPEDNSWISTTSKNFKFSADDEDDEVNCSLYINGGEISSKQVSTGTEQQFSFNGLDEGENQKWSIDCKDSAGNYANKSRNFNVDLTKPNATILSEDMNVSDSTPTIEVVMEDNYASNLSYEIYVDDLDNTQGFKLNKEGSGIENGTPTNITLDQLSKGTYKVYVKAIDNAGNTFSSETITIDISGSVMFLLSPDNNYHSSDDDINFTFRFSSETPEMNCSLYINDTIVANNESTEEGVNTTFEIFDIPDYFSTKWSVKCFKPSDPEVNANDTYNLRVDTEKPKWKNHSRYYNASETGITYINVTFTDNYEVGDIIMENDFDGGWKNTTLNCEGNRTYKKCSYSERLHGGNHTYRFIGNDSTGQVNKTPYFNHLIIEKYEFLLNDKDSDIWVQPGAVVKVYSNFVEPESGDVHVYREDTKIGTCSNANGCSYYPSFEEPGVYNMTANFYSNYTDKTYKRNHLVYVNGTPPKTNIYKNTSHVEQGYENIYINWTASDSFLNNSEFNITDPDGNLIYNSFNSAGEVILQLDNLTREGTYDIRLYADDYSGNKNESQDTFEVTDSMSPSLSIFKNQSEVEYNEESIYINWTSTDLNLDTTEFNVTYPNGTLIYESTSETGEINLTPGDITELGDYEINLWANDTAGNENSISEIFEVVDLGSPEVNIHSPENKTYGIEELLVNITANDEHGIDQIWYNWNGTNVTYTNPTNVTFNQGLNTLKAWTNDTSGNIAKDNVTFTIDTVPLNISILNPGNNSKFNYSNIIFNVSSNKEMEWCGISIDDGDNITMELNNSGTGANYSDTFEDREHYFEVSCNDSVGNTDTSGKYFFLVDTINPNLSIFKNETEVEYNEESIYINWTSTDLNLDTTEFNVTYPNGSVVYSSGNSDGEFGLSPANLTSVGYYNVSLWANDTTGNENSINDSFEVFAEVELNISKTSNLETIDPTGGEFNYIINISNIGYGDAKNITLVENYPENVTFINSTPTPDSGNNTWNFSVVEEGENKIIDIIVDANYGIENGTELVNIVNLTYLGRDKTEKNISAIEITKIIDENLPSALLISPSNASIFNESNVEFICSGMDSESVQKIKLYGSWGSGWEVKSEEEVNGTSTSATFNEDVLDEGKYIWSCEVIDIGGNKVMASQNRTFTVDETPPTVDLIDPVGNKTVGDKNIELTYNVSDNLSNVESCELFIDNSSVKSSNNINENSENNFNVSLNNRVYEWKVSCIDETDNEGFSDTETFNVELLLDVTLNTPKNNSYLNDSNVELNCSAESGYQLSNMTIFLKNGTWTNKTFNVSGYTNTSIWEVENLSEGESEWYCSASNIEGNESTSINKNTFYVDLTNPYIELIEPGNNSIKNEEETTFKYNVTDNISLIPRCDFYLDGAKNESFFNVSKNTVQEFGKEVSEGRHNWSINCNDTSGRLGSSPVFYFNYTGARYTVNITNPYTDIYESHFHLPPTESWFSNYTEAYFNKTYDVNATIDVFKSIYGCSASLIIKPDNLTYINKTKYIGDIAKGEEEVVSWDVNITDAGVYNKRYNFSVNVSCSNAEKRNDTLKIFALHNWKSQCNHSREHPENINETFYQYEEIPVDCWFYKNGKLADPYDITIQLMGTDTSKERNVWRIHSYDNKTDEEVNEMMHNVANMYLPDAFFQPQRKDQFFIIENSSGNFEREGVGHYKTAFSTDYFSNPNNYFVHFQANIYDDEGNWLDYAPHEDFWLLPPKPCVFRGNGTIGERTLRSGDVISAYDANGTKCGNTTVTEENKYELYCSGDNQDSSEDEGARPGDNISFEVNGMSAETEGDAIWETKEIKNVNLSVGAIFDLVSPPNNTFTQNRTFNFNWMHPNTTERKFDLLVANDSSFNDIVLNEPANETEYQTNSSQNLSDGYYFWRVDAFDNSWNFLNKTEYWHLIVDNVAPDIISINVTPKIVEPLNPINVSANISDNRKMDRVVLNMTSPEGLIKRSWEMNISEGLYKFIIPEDEVDRFGQFNLTISAYDKADNLNRTNSSFTVAEEGVADVNITNPEDDSAVEPNTSFNLTANITALLKNINGCNATLLISNQSLINKTPNENYTKSIGSLSKDESISELWNLSTENKTGKTELTVETSCTDGVSDSETITLHLIRDKISYPFNLSAEVLPNQKDIKVNWSEVPGADSYNIYLSQDIDNFDSSPNVTGISGTAWNHTSAEQDQYYFYKVGAVRNTFVNISEETVGKFTFEYIASQDGTKGYNFISLPLNVSYDSETFLEDIPSDYNPVISELDRSDPEKEEWTPHVKGTEKNMFNLSLGEGYMINVNHNYSHTIAGDAINTPTNLSLISSSDGTKGYNAIGIQYHAENYDSETFLEDIPSDYNPVISELDRSDPEKEEWTPHVKGTEKNMFNLSLGEGYMINVNHNHSMIIE